MLASPILSQLVKTITLEASDDNKINSMNKVFCNTSPWHKFEKYTVCDKMGLLDMVVLDSGYLAVAGVSKKIYIVNSETLKIVKVYSGHTDRVNCLVQIQKRLISGSNDKTIRFWGDKIEESRMVMNFPVRNMFPVSNDIFGTWDENDVKVWSVSKREIIYSVAQKARIGKLCVRQDMCVISYSDGSTKMLDLMSGNITKSWNIERSAYLESQCFLSATEVIFSTNSGYKVFDIEKEAVTLEFPKDETNYNVNESFVTTSEFLITACSMHNLIRVFTVRNPVNTQYVCSVLHAHSDTVKAFGLLPNNRFVTASWDGSIMIWKLPVAKTMCLDNLGVRMADVNFVFV